MEVALIIVQLLLCHLIAGEVSTRIFKPLPEDAPEELRNTRARNYWFIHYTSFMWLVLLSGILKNVLVNLWHKSV